MKKILQKLILILLFIQSISCSQSQNDFDEGIFDGSAKGFKYVVEKHGNFQLEYVPELGVKYLHKFEKTGEGEYIVKRYKVLEKGNLKEPNMGDVMKVTSKVKDGKIYYKANLVGTDRTVEGFYIKRSNEISEDFKKILKEED